MGIDPRGPRFGALITTVVLAAVLDAGPGTGRHETGLSVR
jgi:hypothetical protein